MRLLKRAFEGCSRVVVTKLHGGFSGSLVLKTDSYGLDGSRDEPTVTKLDDALPHGLQHRCESRSTTPAPHLSNRPSRSASRRRLPLRGAPCTQLLPARQSQRQPVGVHAAGPDHQLRANFPGARAARSASPPRSGARRKNWAWWGTGRTRFATEVDTKVFYGENLFCRQSRETCESGLVSRVSRSDDH